MPSEVESPFSFPADAPDVPGLADAGTHQEDTGTVSASSFGFRAKRNSTLQESERASQSLFDHTGTAEPLGPDYGYSRTPFGHRNEVSAYTAQMDARYAMDPRTRTIVIMALVVIVLVPLTVISPRGWLTETYIGNGLAGWLDILQQNLHAASNIFSGIEDGNGLRIVFWQTAAVALIGAALATNGAVYQGALKNALASPSTLGVMSGGTLGSIVYLLVFETQNVTTLGIDVTYNSEYQATVDAMSTFDYILMTQGRALCSIVGCFAVVGLVLLIAYIAGRGKVSKAALVIAGQVFASVIAGVTGIVRTYISLYGTEEQMEALRTVVNGSVSLIFGPLQFSLVAVPLVVGFIIVMCLRSRMNLLAFSDDEARSLGISVNVTRNTVMVTCTIMTAVVTSFCGNVGFVGFLVPHLARKIIGPDLRYLLPASALLGSIYLIIANHVMQLGNLLNGSLGSFTSIIGVIFFLVAIIQQRRRGNVDWI